MKVMLIATFCSDKASARETLIDLLCRRKINGTASLVFLAQESGESASENRTKLGAEFNSSIDAEGLIAEFEANASEGCADVVFEVPNLQDAPELDAISGLF